MTVSAPEGLQDFLVQQRWFAAKDQDFEVTDIEVLAEVRDNPPTQVWLIHVAEESQSVAYHLVVEFRSRSVPRLEHVRIGRSDGRTLYDALHDRDVTRDWLTLIDTEANVGGMVGHRVPDVRLPRSGPSLVMTAEQSNTSLVFGDAIIMKVFRRPQPGLHPDVEIHAALSTVGCPHVAQAFGWIDSPAGTFALAQEFLNGGVEGWNLAKSSVRDLLQEGDLHAEEVGGDFASEAERLGEVTAEVHAALRAVLPTSVWTSEDLAGRAAQFQDRLATAVQAAPELAPYAGALSETYAAVGTIRGPVGVQRVHGDLHLGQTMRVPSGWKLLDFEGEPARPMDERRTLDSPFRDVAGMLRSFDYASRQFEHDGGAPTPQAVYRATEWADRNRSAFCAGYATTSGRDPRDEEVLLRAYEADKAVYEVVYELTMRPSWVSIPLAALERLAG